MYSACEGITEANGFSGSDKGPHSQRLENCVNALPKILREGVKGFLPVLTG